MSDDHGPRAGCNYNQCGIPGDASSCPFTRDDKPSIVPALASYLDIQRDFSDAGGCQHEWRQVSNDLDLRFYCIHCLMIEKPITT